MSSQAADKTFSVPEGGAQPLRGNPGLFAGQFLLGPRVPSGLPGWQRVALTEHLYLLAHPELLVTRVGDESASLTVIGFILDPANPAAGNVEVLQRLFERFTCVDALLTATEELGGRWIIIAVKGPDRCLFSDALGLRQVFHAHPEAGAVWAMSQPGMVLELDLFRATPDKAAAEFLDSFEFRSHREYRWPAAASPFSELRRLLPNHVLDLSTGAVRRFWPAGPLARMRPDQAVKKIGDLLRGLVLAAHRRFDFVLALTAGADSRLVLAACREIRDRIAYVTVRQSHMEDHNIDVRIPAALLSRFGLAQTVIRAPASMSPGFSWLFKRNVLLAHDHYGADAEAILNHFHRAKAVMTGSGAEIGRCSFRSELPFAGLRGVTSSDLARVEGMGNNIFALQHMSAWLEDAGETWNINLLDLFEWEQGHGTWLASTQLEFDVAWREIFTPYNCRAVLTAMLSVDEKYRLPPRCDLSRMAIAALWPELLSEPINSGRRRRPLSRLAHRISKRIHRWIPWVGVTQ